ncbi:hypothetical protein Tco_1014712 [Tanacetum coccineum]
MMNGNPAIVNIKQHYGNDVGVHLSSSVFKATCSYFKLKDIFKASIEELKKAMNIQDTLLHALNKQDFPQKTSSIRLQEDHVEDLCFSSLVDTNGTESYKAGAHGISLSHLSEAGEHE